MRRAFSIACIVLTAALLVVPPVRADHNEDVHSENMSLVTNWNDGGKYRQGSDIAFWGNLAVLGNYGEPGGFRLMDISRPAKPRKVGQLVCPGAQADVSVWEDIVLLSVDTPAAEPACGAPAASAAQIQAGTFWEGLRVVSIANRSRPKQVAAVYTDCGSHTHTAVPDLGHRDRMTGRAAPRLVVYILSYPISGQGPRCNASTHGKISIVEVPLKAPHASRVISTMSVSPPIGCHDVTVFVEKEIAAAACLTETQIWDVSEPERPNILTRIRNPQINIHHGTTFSWDAETLVIGDELGGAIAATGCLTGGNAPTGALWFYDISDYLRPVLRGSFTLPQNEVSIFCTSHQMNTIPLRGERDVLSMGWYNGGTAVVDFTDPSAPEQIGYYIPAAPQASAWASYWYRGLIYVNNFDEQLNASTVSRGFDVLRITDKRLRDHVSLSRLNPQLMEPPPRGVG